jgi:MFS family permease
MGCCEQKQQFMPDGTPVTPLPKKKIFALVICSMTWGFQMNIIFPFMPFMVDWMRGTTVDSGMYVGILASAYFWGQFVASFIWPPLSDRIGRKKSLIWGQLALTLPFMGFAFTRSYWMAVMWRFINGVLQSNSPITKAYIADICDRTNSAAGMSVMAFSWGLSNVIAPTLGGLLAEPCVAYPSLFPPGSWQYRWFSHETGAPYALPSIFVFVFGFVIAIPMVFLWLPETSPVTLCDVLHGRCSRDKAAYTHLDEELDEDLDEDKNSTPKKKLVATADASATDDAEEEEEGTTTGVAVPIPSYWEMATARDSGTALGTLALLCPSWITYQELFPLFCKATPAEGGIGFSAYQIGERAPT